MTNKKVGELTIEQFMEIIETIKLGGPGFDANNRVATILMIQAMTGMRLGDVLALKMDDLLYKGNSDGYVLSYRIAKFEKLGEMPISEGLYKLITNYAKESGIGKGEQLFPISGRAVQKILKKVTDFLEIDCVGTRSFRDLHLRSVENAIREINAHEYRCICLSEKGKCLNLERTSCLGCEYYTAAIDGNCSDNMQE
ncbi:hypothetical protein [Butyrivibrio sp. WCE2006]|uniref:hypothetical protein n=1 Tax=Butyrivibrio sp. WCE2006 TaxID=1410611 RepID=UPI0005D1D886|nr:hypothetical protein [Butyrivibrio sp. WCE2006]